MKKFLIYIVLPFLIIGGIVYFSMGGTLKNTPELKIEDTKYSEIITKIKSNEISEINIKVSSGKMTYTERATGEKKTYKLSNPDYFHDDIGSFINENNIQNSGNPDKIISLNYSKGVNSNTVFSLSCTVIMVIIMAVMCSKFMKTINARNNISNNNAETSFCVKGKLKANKNKIRFADVAGAEEEKEELKEIVDFLKNPKAYQEAGARIPKGTLLVGPPGTGKTLFARAVAGEANVPFFSMSGSDFVEMFVGVGAARVRALFEQAKKVAPAIIFIDEIDAIGRKRSSSSSSGAHDEKEQTLNQLLVEMDGFSKTENIIVLAATNRPDVLDKALLRPGRFDRQIAVNLPDIKGREDILKIHASHKKFEDSVNLHSIAEETVGFSGAELENLLNEAALKSVREHRNMISQNDIEESILKVVAGAEKRSLVISPADKKTTAYHEAGHALLAHILPTQDDVQQISIIPRGLAAGLTMIKQKDNNSHRFKKALEDEICVLLGGRAAEEVVEGDVTTGASSDIQRATSIAKNMVSNWGMYDTDIPSCLSLEDCSDKTKRIVDSRAEAIIAREYERAKKLVTENRDKLDIVADVLCKKEKISGAEFLDIIS